MRRGDSVAVVCREMDLRVDDEVVVTTSKNRVVNSGDTTELI